MVVKRIKIGPKKSDPLFPIEFLVDFDTLLDTIESLGDNFRWFPTAFVAQLQGTGQEFTEFESKPC
jgi:hypothetical protein